MTKLEEKKIRELLRIGKKVAKLLESGCYIEYFEGVEKDVLFDTPYKIKIGAEPLKEVAKYILSLLETERSEAVIEYRINFEKGVQNVVENTVAKDRIEEIRKEAVREFAKWLNDVPITVVGDLELGYYISKHLTQTEGKK